MSRFEVIILEPSELDQQAAYEFIGRCLIDGLYVYLEGNDQLPKKLPEILPQSLKAILLSPCQAKRNQSNIESALRLGVKVYIIGEGNGNHQARWQNPNLIYLIMMDSGLETSHPEMRIYMTNRSDEVLFSDMVEQLLDATQHDWHDATRYQWEALLDAYLLSGDIRALDLVKSLITQAMETKNPVNICDTIAPLLAMFEFAQLTHNASVIERCLWDLDRYIDITPRWRNCFVNFNWLAHQARGEIAWQVCPVLAKAGEVTRDSRYLDIAVEQLLALDRQLYNSKVNLWRHGRGDGGTTDEIWSRGCAMVLMGLMRVIELLPDSHVSHEILLSRMKEMAQAIASYQHVSGFWYTVLDESLSGFESSGTAWFTAAFYRGMRIGLLDSSFKPIADRGWDAVKTRVWRGRYPGHNCATTVSPIRSYYVKSHLSPIGWTHFSFRAACERMRYYQSFSK